MSCFCSGVEEWAGWDGVEWSGRVGFVGGIWDLGFGIGFLCVVCYMLGGGLSTDERERIWYRVCYLHIVQYCKKEHVNKDGHLLLIFTIH